MLFEGVAMKKKVGWASVQGMPGLFLAAGADAFLGRVGTRDQVLYMYVHIIHICICTCACVYIYIYVAFWQMNQQASPPEPRHPFSQALRKATRSLQSCETDLALSPLNRLTGLPGGG